MAVSNEKTTVLVVNELRSHAVHARFMEAFQPTHTIKVIPHSKMDEVFQHPNIQIFQMKKKRKKTSETAADEDEGAGNDEDDAGGQVEGQQD